MKALLIVVETVNISEEDRVIFTQLLRRFLIKTSVDKIRNPIALLMTGKITLADDARDIARDAVSRVFMSEASYNHQRVPQIVSQICDTVVAKLNQTAKLPRKYIAHCAVLQKNGAGYHAVSACSWNAGSDGCFVYQAESKCMICILTIYGVTM